MDSESLKPIWEGGNLERNIRCQETHLLIVQMSFCSNDRHRQQNPLLATKEVSQRLFVKPSLKTGTPVLDQTDQVVMEEGCSGCGRFETAGFYERI